MLRFRSGISPVTKNVRNIRYKKKPEFEVEKVKNVETILKDLIDTGFADHVDEVHEADQTEWVEAVHHENDVGKD